tara:strand:+ start:1735 stop:2934 length:1200 start_codon:yes stop_codon:yes gene_type:complete
MASTYTSNIRLEKQADGENPNAWGAILNTNVIDLVDQAVAAYQIVSVSGTTPITLTQVNGATDQSRKAILSFDGTLTAETSIIIPSANKMYYVRNNTSGSFALKIKTAGNTAITIEQGSNVMVASDGTDVYQTAFPTSVSAFTVNSLTATSVSTSVLNASKISTSIVSATNINATSVSAVSGRFSGTVSASAFDGLGNQLSFGSDAQGDVYYYAGNSIARLAAGTDGQFLKTQGSGANPVWADTGGNLMQPPQTKVVTGSSVIGTANFDLSQKPVITSGTEISSLTVSITPTDVSSTIEVDVDLYLGTVDQNIVAVGALFINSETTCLSTAYGNAGTTNMPIYLNMTFKQVATSLGSRTFTVRAGKNTGANNVLLNKGSTEIFGTFSSSKITAKEFKKI